MREQNLKIFSDGLSYLKHLIEGRVVLRLYDLNVITEDTVVQLLNCIRDLNLRNLNEGGVNFPAIDLGDKGQRICYQVTSQKSAVKIQKTLKKFEQHKLSSEYDAIFFLILGSKQRLYSTITPTSVPFDPAKHIIDLGDLAREAATLPDQKLIHLAKLVTDAGLSITPSNDTDLVALEKLHSHFDRDALKHHWHQEGSILGFADALEELAELLGKGTVRGVHVTKPIYLFSDTAMKSGLGAVKGALGNLRAEFNKGINSGEIVPQSQFAYFKDPKSARAINKAKQAVIDAFNTVSARVSFPPIRMVEY